MHHQTPYVEPIVQHFLLNLLFLLIYFEIGVDWAKGGGGCKIYDFSAWSDWQVRLEFRSVWAA